MYYIKLYLIHHEGRHETLNKNKNKVEHKEMN